MPADIEVNVDVDDSQLDTLKTEIESGAYDGTATVTVKVLEDDDSQLDDIEDKLDSLGEGKTVSVNYADGVDRTTGPDRSYTKRVSYVDGDDLTTRFDGQTITNTLDLEMGEDPISDLVDGENRLALDTATVDIDAGVVNVRGPVMPEGGQRVAPDGGEPMGRSGTSGGPTPAIEELSFYEREFEDAYKDRRQETDRIANDPDFDRALKREMPTFGELEDVGTSGPYEHVPSFEKGQKPSATQPRPTGYVRQKQDDALDALRRKAERADIPEAPELTSGTPAVRGTSALERERGEAELSRLRRQAERASIPDPPDIDRGTPAIESITGVERADWDNQLDDLRRRQRRRDEGNVDFANALRGAMPTFEELADVRKPSPAAPDFEGGTSVVERISKMEVESAEAEIQNLRTRDLDFSPDGEDFYQEGNRLDDIDVQAGDSSFDGLPQSGWNFDGGIFGPDDGVPGGSIMGGDKSERRRKQLDAVDDTMHSIASRAGGFAKAMEDTVIDKLPTSLRAYIAIIAALIPLLVTAAAAALGVAAAFGAVALAAGAIVGIGMLGWGSDLQSSMQELQDQLKTLKQDLFSALAPARSAFAPIARDVFAELPNMVGELAESLTALESFDSTVLSSLRGIFEWLSWGMEVLGAYEPIISQLTDRFGALTGEILMNGLVWLFEEAYRNQNLLIGLGEVLYNIVVVFYEMSEMLSRVVFLFRGIAFAAAWLSKVLNNEVISAVVSVVAGVYLLAKALAIGEAAALAFNAALASGRLAAFLGYVQLAAVIVGDLLLTAFTKATGGAIMFQSSLAPLIAGLMVLVGLVAFLWEAFGDAPLVPDFGWGNDRRGKSDISGMFGVGPRMPQGMNAQTANAPSQNTINIYGDPSNEQVTELRGTMQDEVQIGEERQLEEDWKPKTIGNI